MKKSINKASGGVALFAAMNNSPAAIIWQILFASVIAGTGAWSSNRCSLSWKLRETATKRHFVKLLAGKNKSIYPTPLAAEGDRTGEIVNSKKKIRNSGYTATSNLVDMARSGLLPTPTTGSNRNSRSTVLKTRAAHTNHGVALGLTQVIEIGLGVLPKEFNTWNEIPLDNLTPKEWKAKICAETNNQTDKENFASGSRVYRQKK